MTPTDLKAWRAKQGFTQLELAILLGVNPLTLSRWERNDRPIPAWLHLALAGLIHKGAAKRLAESATRS